MLSRFHLKNGYYGNFVKKTYFWTAWNEINWFNQLDIASWFWLSNNLQCKLYPKDEAKIYEHRFIIGH